MNVAVVGGTRFLGLAIVEALVDRGHTVTVVHRGSTTAQLPEGVSEVFLDARQPCALVACLNDGRYEVAIDTILDAATLRDGVTRSPHTLKHFIHCGSTGVYTPMREIPVREGDKCDPPAEFGGFEHKLEQDRVLLNAFGRSGFPATILRPTNIYGPGDIPLDIWGARDPRFFNRLAKSEPVTLPNDGRALLQPGYVKDLGRAFAQAIEVPAAIGQIYNISSPRAIQLSTYLEIMKDCIGSKSEVRYASMSGILRDYLSVGKVNEAGIRFVCEHMSVDISKARDEIGFVPEMTIEEGMARNVAWMRERGIIPRA